MTVSLPIGIHGEPYQRWHRVEAGQLLGLVGNNGNARTTLLHVHFGISHSTFPEDWQTRRGEVNLVPFLLAWRGGHSPTSPLPAL